MFAGPRISVVTPSYNQGRFLADCIRSVVDQHYPGLEYLIIDGGSTDETLAVIEHFREHIAHWVSEPDDGQSDAINKGFRLASGEVIAWLNADDYYLPNALHLIAWEYQRNPEASFYFGDGLRVDEEGRTIARFTPRGNEAFSETALVHGLDYILQPSTFINRKYLDRAGPLDVRLRYGLDLDLWIRLARLAPPVPIAACLAASREYQTTKTASGSFARAEELRRIAEQYSGSPLTPGALLYYLDTLCRVARQRPDVFPAAFLLDVQRFWKSAGGLLARYGAAPDGFPLTCPAEAGAATIPGAACGLALSAKPQAALTRRLKRISARILRLLFKGPMPPAARLEIRDPIESER